MSILPFKASRNSKYLRSLFVRSEGTDSSPKAKGAFSTANSRPNLTPQPGAFEAVLNVRHSLSKTSLETVATSPKNRICMYDWFRARSVRFNLFRACPPVNPQVGRGAVAGLLDAHLALHEKVPLAVGRQPWHGRLRTPCGGVEGRRM